MNNIGETLKALKLLKEGYNPLEEKREDEELEEIESDFEDEVIKQVVDPELGFDFDVEPEDLEGRSYLGKKVIECSICGEAHFADELGEESTCPICSADSIDLKIVGVVAPLEGEIEDGGEDTEEVEIETELVDDKEILDGEELEESKNRKRFKENRRPVRGDKFRKSLESKNRKIVFKNSKNLSEDLKLIGDLSDYEPWSGAVSTWNQIVDVNKESELESYLEDAYPEGLTFGQLNDILWFDGEDVLRDLGIIDEEEYRNLTESKKKRFKENRRPVRGAKFRKSPVSKKVEESYDFNEKSMDKLVIKFLKENYKDVRNYKTTGASITSNGKLKVEGLIRFNTNESKRVCFVTDSIELKEGKFTTKAVNPMFSKNKAFVFEGLIENKNLTMKKMNYRFITRVKNEAYRVQGIATINE